MPARVAEVLRAYWRRWRIWWALGKGESEVLGPSLVARRDGWERVKVSWRRECSEVGGGAASAYEASGGVGRRQGELVASKQGECWRG